MDSDCSDCTAAKGARIFPNRAMASKRRPSMIHCPISAVLIVAASCCQMKFGASLIPAWRKLWFSTYATRKSPRSATSVSAFGNASLCGPKNTLEFVVIADIKKWMRKERRKVSSEGSSVTIHILNLLLCNVKTW